MTCDLLFMPIPD